MPRAGTFKPGNPGNPNGQMRDKIWYNALRSVLHEVDPVKKKKKLELVAQAVVEAALNGDIAAAKEIGDRMDGKAVQALAAENGGNIVIEIIRFTDPPEMKTIGQNGAHVTLPAPE